MFTVDAPLAKDIVSDESEVDGEADEDDGSAGSEVDHDSDSDSDDDDEDSEEEDDEEEEEDDSGPEYDGAELTSYIESGPQAPQIEVPAGVIDLPPSDEVDHKGKKRAIWHDPSDDLVSVDLENDNRLKKLARGKKGTIVNGEELMKRLRKQYVHYHNQRRCSPCPCLARSCRSLVPLDRALMLTA